MRDPVTCISSRRAVHGSAATEPPLMRLRSRTTLRPSCSSSAATRVARTLRGQLRPICWCPDRLRFGSTLHTQKLGAEKVRGVWSIYLLCCLCALGLFTPKPYSPLPNQQDVDFCLRLQNEIGNAQMGPGLVAVPLARVLHEFWSDSPFQMAAHFYKWAVGDGTLFDRFPQHTFRSWPNAAEVLSISAPAFLLGNGLSLLTPTLLRAATVPVVYTIVWVVGVLVVDVVADIALGDFTHRAILLQSPHPSTGPGHDCTCKYKYSTVFLTVAHVVANMYVVVLEAGRLKGHIWNRREWWNVMRRFDWHVGTLPGATERFQHTELVKFSGFVGLLAVVVLHISTRS